MNKDQYSEPVKKLLTYGDARKFREWPDYLKLGLSNEHIPELIAILMDNELYSLGSDTLEVWASIHAWRALGQLRAVEAIPSLLEQLYCIDEYDDDWMSEEIPNVFGMIGSPAIPALTDYVADPGKLLFARICAITSLAKIGIASPDHRGPCVESLTRQLEKFMQNDKTLNAFLVCNLVDLKAVESLSTIQQAFHKKYVELSIMGDLEDVEIKLGVRPRPPKQESLFQSGFQNDQLSQTDFQTQSPVILGKKIGRNEPCPCGSGKKYKKCCWDKIKRE